MSTIRQVAEKAGVSTSTVSRYISQNGYVSQKASQKIEQAIRELHYVPNFLAQSLKTKKNQLVGLLLPDISNPFFPRLARGVEEFLKEQGYRVMLGNTNNKSHLEEEYLNVLLQSNAAGIITTHDFTKNHPEIDIPVVVVDRVNQETQYGVFSDNKEGGKLAAQAIWTAGATNILLIRGPLDKADNLNQRFQGSQNYLLNKGARFAIEDSASFDFAEIQIEAKTLLDHHPDIDSIIAPSDIHAIAYLHEILNRGKRIPEDVQIIGYDDILMSQFIYPSLSTIHQSSYIMRQKAAELIFKITNQLPITNKRIKLPVHYVERETLRRKIDE